MDFTYGCLLNVLRVGYLAFIALAALVDARTRTFPNELAICLLVVSAAYGICEQGVLNTALNALAASAICLPLVAFEVLWRRAVGSSGLGMGDIKYLFAVAWCRWFDAILAFAGGLLLLGAVALTTRRESLPLLPFVAPLLAALVLIA